MLARVRVAFFTAGTIGAGHLLRGLAIERALARRARREGGASGTTFTIFAPRFPYAVARAGRDGARRDSLRELIVKHEELRDPARAKESELSRALREFAPDVLVVDLFWAPLRHVLPLPSCEAWLLLRSVPPKWFVGPPGHPYERSQFARVIAIEPGAGRGHEDETIDPIVIANPDEVKPKRALREALGVASRARLVVVHQVGVPGEWTELSVANGGSAVHAFTLSRDDATKMETPVTPAGVHVHDGDAFFPLAEWLPGADAIASGAGYNAFWEAQWLGYADRTTFTPFARNIDDQAWRVSACRDYVPRENGADALARRLR
jgi:hypothetical protein